MSSQINNPCINEITSTFSNVESLYNSLKCIFKNPNIQECAVMALQVTKKKSHELNTIDKHIIDVLRYAKKHLLSEEILLLPVNLEKSIYNV